MGSGRFPWRETAESVRLPARCGNCYDVDAGEGPGLNHEPMADESNQSEDPHVPSPSLWPIGFAVGIAVLLVGLIVNPLWISTIGGAIALVFGFFWAREATAGLRGAPVVVHAERREMRPAGEGEVGPPAQTGGPAMPHPAPGERV